MLQAHGADAATWTVMGDDCISMGRSKGLPEDLLHELARNQAASTRRRDFRGDERAVRAQEEHAKHLHHFASMVPDRPGTYSTVGH